MNNQWQQSAPRRVLRSALATATFAAVLVATLTPTTSAIADDTAQQAGTYQSATQAQTLVTSVDSNYGNDDSTSESVKGILDQNSSTKWFEGSGSVPSTDSPVYAIYTLSDSAKATGYVLTSANDSAERDPSSWTILGSNDDAAATDADSDTWETLDTQSSQQFSSRKLAQAYVISSPAAYKYYQLRVTGNKGSTKAFQLAD